MGYYIETTSLKGKADAIKAFMGVTEYATPNELMQLADKDNIPVVVVDNGPFEAAAIAYNRDELTEFVSPNDYRPKRYLLVPRAVVIAANPRVESALNW